MAPQVGASSMTEKVPDPADVTLLLQAVTDGREGSDDELLEAVYHELRALAASRMRREKPGQTLQATALVHEAWLRLLGGESNWNDRRHFFGAASRAMRQILVERHRRVNQIKRGGELDRIDDLDVDGVELTAGTQNSQVVDLMALDEALSQLEQQDPRMAEIVQLRYFAGLSVEDTALALEISPRTVKREWAVARGWLARRMGEEE